MRYLMEVDFASGFDSICLQVGHRLRRLACSGNLVGRNWLHDTLSLNLMLARADIRNVCNLLPWIDRFLLYRSHLIQTRHIPH